MVRKRKGSNNSSALGYANRKRRRRKPGKLLKQHFKKNNSIKIFFNLVFIIFLIYVVNKSEIISDAFRSSDKQKKIKVSETKKKLSSAKKTLSQEAERKKFSKTATASKGKVTSFKDKTSSQKQLVEEPKVTSVSKKSKRKRDGSDEIAYHVIPPVISLKKISTKRPKLVFIIDDIGNNLDYEDELVALGDQVTYAILPKLTYSQHFSRLSRKTNAEVITHLPLEAMGGRFPGPGLIADDMTEVQIKKMLVEDLKTVPESIGVNNHMGSSGSANRRVMNIIIEELKKRNLFIIDSYTTTQSVILDIAKENKMPILKRDIFIDNQSDENYILGQLQFLVIEARKKGYAIAIGHYRPETLKLLLREIPKLEKNGFDIISISKLIKFIK